MGSGEGGERLHYSAFAGPWTYADEPKGEPTGEDAAWLAEAAGADTIRQALQAQIVGDLTIIIAPVVSGGGKRLAPIPFT